MAKASFDLKAWALLGAQRRLRELDEERHAILAAFPQLRGDGIGARRQPGTARLSSRARTGTGRSRKRRMSAEARRRISEAQKARWAKQKGATAQDKRRATA
jgi:hypothetical protein